MRILFNYSLSILPCIHYQIHLSQAFLIPEILLCIWRYCVQALVLLEEADRGSKDTWIPWKERNISLQKKSIWLNTRKTIVILVKTNKNYQSPVTLVSTCLGINKLSWVPRGIKLSDCSWKYIKILSKISGVLH